jgi:hypothetical protein
VIRRALLLALLPAAGACTELTATPPTPRPTVEIKSPIPDVEVPFNTPFRLEVRAATPVGRLSQLQVVLRGATSARRTLPLAGAAQTVAVELAVPRDALVGPDRLPLDVVVVAEAAVDGRTVTSPAAGVTLRMVDRTAPTLSLSSPDALATPPAGVDLAFPAGGGPVRLSLQVEDPLGGVVRMGLELPAALGGPRSQTLPAARAGRLDLVVDAPAGGDFELLAWAEDAAVSPNRGEARYRVRIGAGGEDAAPPEVRILAPSGVACGGEVALQVVAEDRGGGPERLVVTLPTGPETRYGPDPLHPSALTLTATVAGPRPAGARVAVRAYAVDVFGWRSPVVTATLTAVDDAGPALAAAVAGPVRPGETLTATVGAAEGCGALSAARLTLVDAAGTATTAQVALQGAAFAGPLAFPVPRGLCALGPAEVHLEVFDDAGLASAPARATLPVADRQGPEARITSLVPGGRVRPGQLAPVQVELTDLASGVASATVTVTAVDAGGAALAEVSARWPGGGCGDRGPRLVDVPVLVPPDLRLGPGATLEVTVRAADHSGAAATSVARLPILDDAPPLVRFLSPAPGTILAPGATATVTVAVRDVNHDVAAVRLLISGPGDVGGAQDVLRAVGAASATVSFALHVDPAAPLGAPLDLVLQATDTAAPPVTAQASLPLGACGAPTLSAVAPALAPVGGDVPLALSGAGWLPGRTRFSVAGAPLDAVRVTSATTATAHLPTGAYAPGLAAVTVENACGPQTASSVLPDALRFVAPPVARRLRPAPGAGTTPGATLWVAVGAQADGVPLSSLGAQLAGGGPAIQPLSLPQGTLDAALLVPATATAAVPLTVWAEDSLGQRVELTEALPLDGHQLVEAHVHLPRPAGAVGELLPYAVEGRGRDDARRDATLAAGLTSSRPDRVAVVGPGRLRLLSAGTATLTATLGALTAQATVTVLDGVLYQPPGPLLVSPLPLAGSASAAPARLEVLRMAGGLTEDVSAQVSWSVVPPELAVVQGGLLFPLRAGAGVVQADLPGLPGVTRALVVSTRLDVAAGQAVTLPPDQRFLGGQVLGVVTAQAPASGPWRLALDSGAQLRVGASGRVALAGAPGWASGAGGHAGPGAGGGGGQPPGVGAPSGQASGAGGGPAGGGAGGGGGGAAGPGGVGGHPVGQPTPAGGPGGLFDAVGGGGAADGGGGGGGGGGGRALLSLAGAHLVLDGVLDLQGGLGGAGTSTAAAGGGGAGGRLLLEAGQLTGAGRIRVAGGPGADGLSGGGGGGGGAVTLVLGAPPSPYVDVDRAGGAAGAGAAGQVAAEAGGGGAVTR